MKKFNTSGAIAVALGISDTAELRKKLREAKTAGAELIELRLDAMSRDATEWALSHIYSPEINLGLDFMLTHRMENHGGPEGITLEKSRRHWSNLFYDYPVAVRKSAYLDWELELARSLQHSETLSIASVPIPWEKIIVSHHDFTGVPDEETLEELVREATALPAGIMKFAFMVNSDEELQRLLKLYSMNVSEKPMIVIGMGEKGIETRLRWLELGSHLTFARIDTGTAPGQPHISELLKIKDAWRKQRAA